MRDSTQCPGRSEHPGHFLRLRENCLMRQFLFALFAAAVVLTTNIILTAAEPVTSDGWTATSPRDEIRPVFRADQNGGVEGSASLVIAADSRPGLDGFWVKSFPVTGGQHYKFAAFYKVKGVEHPRRSVIVKLDWKDDKGAKVSLDEPAVTSYLRGVTGMAETEFPATHKEQPNGWTEMSDTYQAPKRATQAVVE